MKLNPDDTYGERLFAELARHFPKHDLGLIDVFVAGLNDDRKHISYRIKCDGRLLVTRWPRTSKTEWLSEYTGIRFDHEMIRYVYEQMMVELGYWRVNDPDTGDYFPVDPDRFFLFVDNTTNHPIEQFRLFKSFQFPEDV
jgi:hypothetical protein